MKNGFYYQALLSSLKESTRFSHSRFLRELNLTGGLEDVGKFREGVQQELLNTQFADSEKAEYFLFLLHLGIQMSFYSGAAEEFEGYLDLFDKRKGQLENAGADIESWENYFSFLSNAFARTLRQISIEAFEMEIDEIDWSSYDQDFIYRLSGVIGNVYLSEQDASKQNKGRFWMQKAISEAGIDQGFVFVKHLADYYLSNPGADNLKRLEQLVDQIADRANTTPDMKASKLYTAAVFELQARIGMGNVGYDDENTRADHDASAVKEQEKSIREMMNNDAIPSFVKAFLKRSFALQYADLAANLGDEDEQSRVLRLAKGHIEDAMDLAEQMREFPLLLWFRLTWLRLMGEAGENIPEKDIKELVQAFRKTGNMNIYAEAVIAHVNYHRSTGNNKKAYEVAQDLVRQGNKKVEEGGYFLVNTGFDKVREIMEAETNLPGVSWIVDEVEFFFDRLIEVIEGMEAQLEAIGTEAFNRFVEIFNDFQVASNFNIKVYYRYQLYQMKLMRLVSLERDDTLGLSLANNLLNEIGNENNPLSFIDAKWDEFKDIPNSIRNKTLNKCISISKGDLPLAAEHLDFSYRNLRSYITFKEVNRLGFFLDHQETGNKQLEAGIRLMFHDLYKNGTIFEVVFDMPRFLVDFANQGFSSQDMEESLKIKGTTAKKYIKIMMEIGMIKQEKSVGRKHFYTLRVDSVMNRLGKEKKVLVANP